MHTDLARERWDERERHTTDIQAEKILSHLNLQKKKTHTDLTRERWDERKTQSNTYKQKNYKHHI
jgi:hypothetical protein